MDVKLDENAIWSAIENGRGQDFEAVNDVLDKATELRGLTVEETSTLMGISDPVLLGKLFETAHRVKEEIYGPRLVIFAPLYISNLCANECTYCAFRARNKSLVRSALNCEEITQETKAIISQGHKRLLLVAGEAYPNQGFSYILDAIDAVYAAKESNSQIRRINVNIAPLSVNEFSQLKDHKIGTYQIFQETYHSKTYHRVHLKGKKTDYQWRIDAIDRAMQAGVDDVGIGVLFGLFDWRFEVIAMMKHIEHLEKNFGVGPHTISVPRLEPATGSDLSIHPPMPVSDLNFRKIVAVLRLAVPYTGIIMSTRESAKIRAETFALGVSQISAGSRTNPGGYSKSKKQAGEQFSLGDHRPLDEVVRDVAALGYVPSFCTSCYRLGRTGRDFMDLAKPGEIKNHCDPNALTTFAEYLLDYAGKETKTIGMECIENTLVRMATKPRAQSQKMIEKIQSGKRDVFC